MKLIEHKSPSYPPRTAHNAKTADLTAAFAEEFDSRGEVLTKEMAGEKYVSIDLKLSPVEAARVLFAECRKRNVQTLNIAGNGIYTLKDHGWTQDKLNLWMYEVLRLVHKHHPLIQIISGGQTGVDFAGGIAGEALGLNPVMTFPKGFKQRTLKVYELVQTEADVMATVDTELKALREAIPNLPPMAPSKTRVSRAAPPEDSYSPS